MQVSEYHIIPERDYFLIVYPINKGVYVILQSSILEVHAGPNGQMTFSNKLMKFKTKQKAKSYWFKLKLKNV